MISLTVHSPKCLYFWESERFSSYFSFCKEEPEAHFPPSSAPWPRTAISMCFLFPLNSARGWDWGFPTWICEVKGLPRASRVITRSAGCFFLPWSESSIQSQRKETEDIAGTFCHCNQCKPEVEVETVRFTLCHESYKKSSFCTKGCVGICRYSCTLFTILVAGLLSYYKGSSVKEQSNPAD